MQHSSSDHEALQPLPKSAEQGQLGSPVPSSAGPPNALGPAEVLITKFQRQIMPTMWPEDSL